jgi:allantoate deiminase
METYLKRAARILGQINDLATFSEEAAVLTRTYGTDAYLQARRCLQQWMAAAGLQTRIDNIGNVRGRLESPLPNTKTLVIASHFDTVANAGRFDGPLGVLMGLDLLAGLARQPAALPFHLELIAFCDEEGLRFHTTYLGSKAVAGTLEAATLQKKDAAGMTLDQVIRTGGGDPGQLSADAIKPRDWLGYFEIHLEQGPVLYGKRIPAAVVTAIAGQHRVEVGFNGTAGHAGTVPMAMRRDALCAAAEFILAVEQYARNQPEGLVATVGKLHIPHEASNVIPGRVTCSLDLRSAGSGPLSSAARALEEQAQGICRHRHLHLDWSLVQQTGPVRCDPALTEILSQAIRQSGQEVLGLVSGAGHDAVAIASVAPVAMLFVSCREGISHHPGEEVSLPDIAASLQVAENFIWQCVEKYQPGP